MTLSPNPDPQPYKILVVDDDAAQRRLARATLTGPKYLVIEAADGRQAVERLHGEDFDAVLLDKRMRRKIELDADYVGFDCPDHFVVGYGMDVAHAFRELPFVGIVKGDA